MLALRLNDKYLTLAPNTSANVNLVNPFFDRDGAERLYTFPFKLTNSPENLDALRHANRLDRRSGTTTYTGAKLIIMHQEFETDGVLELDGQAYNAKEISVVFKNEVPDLLEELDDIDIDEILETVSCSLNPPDAVWTLDVAAPPNVYTLSIGTISVGAGLSETSGLSIVEIIILIAGRVNTQYPGMATTSSTQLFLDAEMLEEYPVDFVDGGLSIASIVSPSQALQTGFHNHVTEVNETPVATHCFPWCRWFGLYAGNNKSYTSHVNLWLDGDLLENNPYDEPEWETTFIPFVKHAYIISRIVASSDLLSQVTGYHLDDDIQELIIFNNRTLDELSQNYYGVDVLQWLNHFQQEINLNDHVPEMSASEYLARLLAGFACWFRFRGGTLEIIKKRDQLNKKPLDWTPLCEPNWSANRRALEGFTLEFGDFEDRYVVPGQLEPIQRSGGKELIKLPFHSAYMSSQSAYVAADTVKIPTLRQQGSGEEGGLGENDYQFRLLFFRGLQDSLSGDPYPLASHDNTDINDVEIGDLSFELTAAAGLYEQNHKGVLQLLNDGEEVTVAARLGIEDLLLIRKWENTRRIIRFEEGQMVGVIKSVQFKVSQRGISIAKVVLVKEP